MRIRLRAVLIFFPFFVSGAGAEEQLLFQSGQKQTALIELFTSEGCSSCPPAESWLSKLSDHPGLWKEFVPMAFHVDYWDSLGWKDRFSSAAYTQRQQAYVAAWKAGAPYTPAFAVNGREMRSPALPGSSASDVGSLQVLRRGYSLTISYKPVVAGEWDGHVALLGNGIASKVSTGENAGRELRHDFVVLKYSRLPLAREGDSFVATYQLSLGDGGQSPRPALAVWVTARGQITPVQATGGWLPK